MAERSAWREWLPDGFVVVLLLTVVTASLAPVSGVAARVLDAVTSVAITLLFFLHGAKLSRENLIAAVRHWRLHLTILSITFAVFPLLGFVASRLLPHLLPPELWTGVVFLCTLPSTIQSSIAFTSMARGNVGGTIASAAASNLLGIALTPLLIGLLMPSSSGNVSFAGVWNIVQEMFLPFVAGHLCRPRVGAWVERHKAVLSINDRGTIVLAVYSAFSAAVVGHLWRSLPPVTVLLLLGVCLALLAAILASARAIALAAGFARADEVSIVFCGSKKSLVSGVPMARVLFAGPHVGAAILPLMIFHQTQLIVCAWIARRYAQSDDGITPRKSETLEDHESHA